MNVDEAMRARDYDDGQSWRGGSPESEPILPPIQGPAWGRLKGLLLALLVLAFVMWPLLKCC